MDERRDKFISLLAALALLAFLAVFAVLNFRYEQVFCDGDVYTDMALSREIWRQKSLFPSNWIFGNQYYIHEQSIAALAEQSEKDWKLRIDGQLCDTGNNLNVTGFDELRTYINQEISSITTQE